MDSALFASTVTVEDVPGKGKRLKLAFTLEPARRVDVVLDGKSRPAYHVGGPTANGKVAWIHWTGNLLGTPGDRTSYPVYVQAHALHRLEERLDPLMPWRCHYDLGLSIARAKIVEARGDEWLVEYAIHGNRLGYLVARRAGNAVVLTTFLFLTLQGTPEAKVLADKLRMRRPDIEFQRLDRLSSFIGTDIRNDPTLMKLFEECGCAQLCRLGDVKAGIKPGYADDLRKFLRLDEPSQRERLEDRLGIELPEAPE